MEGKQFSNQVPLILNFSGQPMTFYVKKLRTHIFATTQYTGATSQAVVISLRQTNLNENYELSSEEVAARPRNF